MNKLLFSQDMKIFKSALYLNQFLTLIIKTSIIYFPLITSNQYEQQSKMQRELPVEE